MLRVIRIFILVVALCTVAVGLAGGIIGVAVGILDPTADLLAVTTLSVSFLSLTVGLGLAVAWQAWQALQGRASAPFRPRKTWLLLLAFVSAVVAGQLILSFDLLPVVTFPLFHVTAAALPPLFVLALAGWALGGVTRWRDVVLQTSSGALVSTVLAFILETGFVLALLFAVFVVVAIQPGGADLLQRFADQLGAVAELQDLSELAFLARSPVVLAAALLIAAGAIPAIEESVKTLGVALFAYRRPSLPEAFLWGLAGGAGFALAEGLINSAGALPAWTPVVLMRVGATLLHCFTGALMGLAWYHLLTRQRWAPALGLYAAAIGLHALWNAMTVGLTLLSLATLDSGPGTVDQMLVGLGAVGILLFLIFLGVGTGLGLVGLTVYIRKRYLGSKAPQTGQVSPVATPPFAESVGGEAL